MKAGRTSSSSQSSRHSAGRFDGVTRPRYSAQTSSPPKPSPHPCPVLSTPSAARTVYRFLTSLSGADVASFRELYPELLPWKNLIKITGITARAVGEGKGGGGTVLPTARVAITRRGWAFLQPAERDVALYQNVPPRCREMYHARDIAGNFGPPLALLTSSRGDARHFW